MRALGLDGGEAWTGARGRARRSRCTSPSPARCAAGCTGCYLDARPDGDEPPRATLVAALDALRDAGVLTVAFGGGEPTTRDDLGALAEEARARGITPVLTTSGLGLDRRATRAPPRVRAGQRQLRRRRARLRDACAASTAPRAAERAIERLAAAGIPVGVNVVLTRDDVPRIHETLERARALGAREAQLLRYKPAGRAASLDYLARRLSPGQAAPCRPTLRALARDPLRATAAFACGSTARSCRSFRPTRRSRATERLARFGVFGCEAAARSPR